MVPEGAVAVSLWGFAITLCILLEAKCIFYSSLQFFKH